jgi:hypothetical protein
MSTTTHQDTTITTTVNFIEHQQVQEQHNKPKIQQPLVQLLTLAEQNAQQRQEQFPNIDMDAIVENIIAKQISTVAEQMALGVMVPVRPHMNQRTDHELWLLRMSCIQLQRSMNPYNPYGGNIFEKESKAIQMEEREFMSLFNHVPIYTYVGRKLYNIAREHTKIFTREEFIATFGTAAAHLTWTKNTATYSMYLKFPIILTYNKRRQEARFHFLVSVFHNVSGKKIEQNFSRKRKRVVRVQEETVATVSTKISTVLQ